MSDRPADLGVGRGRKEVKSSACIVTFCTGYIHPVTLFIEKGGWEFSWIKREPGNKIPGGPPLNALGGSQPQGTQAPLTSWQGQEASRWAVRPPTECFFLCIYTEREFASSRCWGGVS